MTAAKGPGNQLSPLFSPLCGACLCVYVGVVKHRRDSPVVLHAPRAYESTGRVGICLVVQCEPQLNMKKMACVRMERADVIHMQVTAGAGSHLSSLCSEVSLSVSGWLRIVDTMHVRTDGSLTRRNAYKSNTWIELSIYIQHTHTNRYTYEQVSLS